MARPPSTNPATELVKARCTPGEKSEIRKRAAAAGVSLSAYVLSCALGRVVRVPPSEAAQ